MEKMEDVKRLIKTDNAVLFCGAGFSCDLDNLFEGEQTYLSVNDERELSHPMLASKLAEYICKLGNFKISHDLQFAADYYIDKFRYDQPKKIDDLVEFLRKQFSIKCVKNGQKNICSYSYRRIYTTNYDDAIETASKDVGIRRDALTMNDSASVYAKGYNNILHINGFIEKLTSESLLEGQLKLSDSSYVSSTSFEDNIWSKVYRDDISRASILLFIGYSLPQVDIDIKRILMNGNYINKTFFVVREGASEEEIYTLKRYGTVFPIGVEKFGQEIGRYLPSLEEHTYNSVVFNQYELVENDKNADWTVKDISDMEILSFFKNGNIKQEYIDAFMLGLNKKRFLIYRKVLDDIYKSLKSNTHVLINGSLGNGKTILVYELSNKLTSNGYKVFSPSGKVTVEKLKDEFDKLMRAYPNDKLVLCIDNVDLYEEFIDYISMYMVDRILLVLTTRKIDNLTLSQKITPLLRYNINTLEYDSELKEFAKIITDLGFLNEINCSTENKKMEYLRGNCNSCISEILLDVFDSVQIKIKLDETLKPLLTDNNCKDTVFALCFWVIVGGIPYSDGLISEIAGNKTIYDMAFRSKAEFKEVFNVNYGEPHMKSSLFPLFILKNIFSNDYIIEALLNVAKTFDKSQHIDAYHKCIFLDTLKFSFIERIFNDANKKVALRRYYDNLKSNVTWLTNEPSYWMQYGMAEIACNDYDNAQRYFDTGYNIAEHKKTLSGRDYDFSALDNQQARLLLLRAAKRESDKKKILALVSEAISILDRTQIDEYRFRQLALCAEVYRAKKGVFDKETERKFAQICIKERTLIEKQVSANLSYSNNLNIYRELCCDLEKCLVV